MIYMALNSEVTTHVMWSYGRMAKRAHRTYIRVFFCDDEECVNLRTELASPNRMERGRVGRISQETGIPIKTLGGWRRQLQRDCNWKPTYGRKNVPLKVTEAEERQVLDCLQREYLDQQRMCSKATVRYLFNRELGSAHDGMVFGTKFIDNFLDRNGLSVRAAHTKRRSEPDDEKISQFLAEMDAVGAQFPDDLVINIDETCWRLVNGRLTTIAQRGSDNVTISLKQDPKTDITAIAACSRSGEKLPLWILCAGTTVQCTKKYTEHPLLRHYVQSKKLIVHYSPRGWSTSSVMIEYLKWLRNFKGKRTLHVLWDVHASHRDLQVLRWASDHDVGLSFIPAGQTDVWQPLDRKIFGSLKQRSMKLLYEDMIHETLEDYDLVHAIKVLLRAWELVTEEEVANAWSHFE